MSNGSQDNTVGPDYDSGALRKVIFTHEDKKKRTIILPSLSPGYTDVMRVALERQGYRVETLPFADQEAIELGKRYVHNDICFPAQINVGEVLKLLKSGRYRSDEVAVGLSKNCETCRALQYYVLARKGLDQCGFKDIPIATSGKDPQGLHPGFIMNVGFQLTALRGMIFLDALSEMQQKVVPYEKNPGESQRLFDHYLELGMQALGSGKYKRMLRVVEKAVVAFNAIETNRAVRRPRVGIVGEILVNYHPAGNYRLRDYLLANGIEVVLPPIFEFWRQDIVNLAEAAKHKFRRSSLLNYIYSGLLYLLYNGYLIRMEKRLKKFKFYEKREGIFSIARNAEGILEQAFDTGEGWLLPGEIISMIKKGVRSFVVVQPFGCMPNHISGRGTIKAIKERYPQVQILAIDYDPDVSIGNIENRLQMLIITARELARAEAEQEAGRAARTKTAAAPEGPLQVREPADPNAAVLPLDAEDATDRLQPRKV